jgi:hypothetical protein
MEDGVCTRCISAAAVDSNARMPGTPRPSFQDDVAWIASSEARMTMAGLADKQPEGHLPPHPHDGPSSE